MLARYPVQAADNNRPDLRIDILKGLAILGVLWQHSLQWPQYAAVGAPLWERQDVAMFMVIAGLNSAHSFARRGVHDLADGYSWPALSRSLWRLLPAYLLTWLIQVFLVGHESGGSPQDYLLSFLRGGWDWGNYFVPVIFGHVLLFPLVYWLALRWPRGFLPAALAVALGFEAMAYVWRLPNAVYEPIYLRYLFAVALGVWLARSRPAGLWIWAMGAFSGLYIFGLDYASWSVPLNGSWASRAAPAQPWALAYVAAGLVALPASTSNRLWQGMAELGRASYHIFLVQGIFFWRFFASWPGAWQYWQAILIMALVASLGWLFYKAELAGRAAFAGRQEPQLYTGPVERKALSGRRQLVQPTYYSSSPRTRNRSGARAAKLPGRDDDVDGSRERE